MVCRGRLTIILSSTSWVSCCWAWCSWRTSCLQMPTSERKIACPVKMHRLILRWRATHGWQAALMPMWMSGRVCTKGAPYAQVSLERKVWPAREQDMARLEQSLDAGDGATCCICLEAMDEYENVVATACGHAFHASCCRQSEYVEVRATASWKCPICRDEVTTARCCYKNIFLDQSPLPETTGAGLATLIKGNIILGEVLDQLLQLGVVGCRRAPTSTTAASDGAGLLQTAAEQLLDAKDGDRFGRVRRSAVDWNPGVAQSQLAIKLFPPAGLVRTDEEMMAAKSSVRQRVFAAFGCFPSMWRSSSAQLQRGSVGYRRRHPPGFP